jgi:hypothetical protein
MDILDELKLGPEPATDPAAKARIEAALQAHVPHRQTRGSRERPRIARIAAIAVAVLMVGGAALAETSPWRDEQQGWSSMTALVSHDPSTMVLGAVPQLLHCTSSLADCTTEDAGAAGERPVIFLFRAGEAPSTTIDHRAELARSRAGSGLVCFHRYRMDVLPARSGRRGPRRHPHLPPAVGNHGSRVLGVGNAEHGQSVTGVAPSPPPAQVCRERSRK